MITELTNPVDAVNDAREMSLNVPFSEGKPVSANVISKGSEIVGYGTRFNLKTQKAGGLTYKVIGIYQNGQMIK